MQRQYDEFHPKEAGWLRRTLMPWVVILAMMVMFCTVLTSDALITSEQRIALYLQTGFFPVRCSASAYPPFVLDRCTARQYCHNHDCMPVATIKTGVLSSLDDDRGRV
jgi:hypothetical protein